MNVAPQLKKITFAKFPPAPPNQCWSLFPALWSFRVWSTLCRGEGGKFYLGLGCSKIRQKRSSVSLLLKPIVGGWLSNNIFYFFAIARRILSPYNQWLPAHSGELLACGFRRVQSLPVSLFLWLRSKAALGGWLCNDKALICSIAPQTCRFHPSLWSMAFCSLRRFVCMNLLGSMASQFFHFADKLKELVVQSIKMIEVEQWRLNS